MPTLTIKWHVLDDVKENGNQYTEYEEWRWDFIRQAEGSKTDAYYDTAHESQGGPKPTIGIGFNLQDSTMFDLVVDAIFYPVGGQTDTNVVEDKKYVDEITEI